MKKLMTFFGVLIIASIVITSCGGGETSKNSENKNYKTVKIGEQVWMAENLNYETSSGSWCYDDDPANCEKYGRLYDWETAKNVCPKGWRLPTKSDFETLLNNVGGEGEEEEAYNALKEGGSSGFSALLGGCRYYNGFFYYLGIGGGWWSSSEYDTYNPWSLHIYSGTQGASMYSNGGKEWGFSVRCLQD